MTEENFSSGFDVVLIGVGSYHVTLPPSEEYFRSQLYYNKFMLTISSNEEQLSYDFELKHRIQF